MNFVTTSRNLLFSIVGILLNVNYVKEESEYKTEKPYNQAWEVLIVYFNIKILIYNIFSKILMM